MRNRDYEVVIGLEVHAELCTETKIFCGCKNAFGAEVNTLCCPVCMGMPGTLPVLKHFPGYGNNVDTHTGIAVDDRPMETFENSDLLPFKAGIEAGAPFVLVSHNIVNCMDPELPASLSPAVHKILREECGFDGIAITDDLAMDAVKAYAKDGAVAVLALQAGNDMVVTTDYRTQIPAVIAAVQEGTLDESVIDDACLRVLRCKDTFLGIPESDS